MAWPDPFLSPDSALNIKFVTVNVRVRVRSRSRARSTVHIGRGYASASPYTHLELIK